MKHLKVVESQSVINQLISQPISGDGQPCVFATENSPKVIGYLPKVSNEMVVLINDDGYCLYRKLDRFNEIGKDAYGNLGYKILGKIDYNGYKILNTPSKTSSTAKRYYPQGNTEAFAYTTNSTVHANAILFSVSGLISGDMLGVGKGDYSSFSDSRKITTDGTYLIQDSVLYNAPWGFKLWNSSNTSNTSRVTVSLEAIFRDF